VRPNPTGAVQGAQVWQMQSGVLLLPIMPAESMAGAQAPVPANGSR